MGRECLGIVRHFKQRQEEDSKNYFAMDFGMMVTYIVFFGLSQSRSLYLQFYDILVFDVMHKTNKFRMPLNHLQVETIYNPSCSEVPCSKTKRWNVYLAIYTVSYMYV